MSKVGRNALCPCGSGKKYKRCHGDFAHDVKPPSPIEIQASQRSLDADEILRTRAEGYGRSIIATDFKGHRVVAVGKKLFFGQGWRFFTDFLLYHMREVLGPGWCKNLQKSGTAHPLSAWLRDMNAAQAAAPRRADGLVEVVGAGSVATVFRFAYALYLIAHHDQLPSGLVRRLKKSSEFEPAVIETFAAAAFALAGFKIEMGETRKGSGPEGEFKATSSKSGKSFNIEAKRKQRWKSDIEFSTPEFCNELKVWLQRKLYIASRKRLENPIYWFELSIPTINGPEGAERLQEIAREALREAEKSITIEGEIPSPAYIFITSDSYLAGAKTPDATMFMLEGFHIRMHAKGDQVEIEKALEDRDRDRDAVWVFECLQRIQHVPHYFDGTPDALVDDNREPIKGLRVGERLEVTFPDTSTLRGLVTEVVSRGETAMVVLMDEKTGTHNIAEVPLTKDEQRAAALLGDAVFGNPNGTQRIPEDDPLALYDFLLDAYARTPREKLLEFLAQHRNFTELQSLPTEQLRVRVCREWTKAALAQRLLSTASDAVEVAPQV